jgi:hypothetical protein
MGRGPFLSLGWFGFPGPFPISDFLSIFFSVFPIPFIQFANLIQIKPNKVPNSSIIQYSVLNH